MRHAIAAAVMLFAAPVDAGQYQLEVGHGVEVCEAYAKNLRAVAPDPERDWRMCPIPIDRTVAELQSPTWQGSDTKPVPAPFGVDVYKRIDDYIWERGVNPAAYFPVDQWPLWRGTAEQINDARQSFFRRRERFFSVPSNLHMWTLVDVDNDGVLEPVYHDNRSCFYLGFGSLLIVLTSDYSNIDRAKTDLVMVHPPRAQDSPVFRPARGDELDLSFRVQGQEVDLTLAEDPLLSSRFDIFEYRDGNYITYFEEFPPRSPRDSTTPIHVYRIEKDRKREVCTYRYVP